MRTHVNLPDDLVAEIDRIAGPRGRSAFIEDAVRYKLLNERQKRAIEAYIEEPDLDPADYPHWSTSEKVSQWVRGLRDADNKRLERKLKNLPH